jgi:heterodisulfide reductase subunit C
MISSIIFIFLLIATARLFTKNARTIRRNILLGRDVKVGGAVKERLWVMTKVALGQSKMAVRPIAGFFHLLIYVGFIIINIEILEIIIDGIFGTHRIFAPLLPTYLYNALIVSFEFFALGVILACAIFLIRRNILKLKRFWNKEMTTWPRTDANIILITEITLMAAFLTMNCTDGILQSRGAAHYIQVGTFPVSSTYAALFTNLSDSNLIFIERFCWWFHITLIFAFINYIPYSKHFHIFLAFPNVYYSNLNPKGQFTNLESVTNEVKAMLDTSFTPPPTNPEQSMRFGAKEVTDLSWKQLMDAYSCTECGRCTDVCPANMTGKLLSPRKIMMDTRDRLVEVGKNIDKNSEFIDDGKSLGSYITNEELWACTSCNACVEACPVNIDPLSIITDMRRFLVMEESGAPAKLNTTFTNIENNGSPWRFSQSDRLNWKNE